MTATIGLKLFEVLMVEDNPGDIRLTREALKDAKLAINLNDVGDGMEALDYLNHRGQYSSVPRPDLILLDLNLPKKDGRQVLAEIKNDDSLKNIPVVVLTTSKAEEDIIKTYNLHANCYVGKPIDLDQFTEIVHAIETFWFSIVQLPSAAG